MTAQEPIDIQDFITSFKGFMDKAVAQAPSEPLALLVRGPHEWMQAGVDVEVMALERRSAESFLCSLLIDDESARYS